MLNDGRSPVLSAIKQTNKYSTEPLPDSLADYESSVPGELKDYPIDAGTYRRDNRRLKGLHAELGSIKTAITDIQDKLNEEAKSLEKEQLVSSYKKWKSSKAGAMKE